jgi:chemotaxis protein methyltransferase CheR
MDKAPRTRQQLVDELAAVTARLLESDEYLRAIRTGEVDALVVATKEGDRIFSLSGADHPYRAMVETMNEGAITLAANGTILFCNQRFADIVKEPLEKVMGSSIYPYVAATDLPLFTALLQQALAKNRTAELRLLNDGGNSVPVLLAISALKNTDIPGLLCLVITDLTEQKRDEKMLAEGRLTSQIFQQATDIFVICDQQGQIINTSHSANRLFENSPIFQKFDELFHLVYCDGTPFVLLSAMDSGLLIHREVIFRPGDQEPFVFLLSAKSIIMYQKAISIVVVMVDITARKKMEVALQKAHDNLEQQVRERTNELLLAIQEAEKRKQIADNALHEIKKLKVQLEAEQVYLQEEIKLEYNHENIIGQSDGLKYVLYKVEQIAHSNTTVLVLGETGTGKELIARAIHHMSLRQNRALLKVNCATLPANLIESELFGHEKGAFTGSVAKHLGRFEVANGATLFLDEIGELPLELQSKLLRVIQDGEFERLGSSHSIKVDVRIIAATNRNLEEEVRQGRFRQDLWYRINVFPITIPPLRDRRNDIPMLVDFYIKKISKRLGKSIVTVPINVMNELLHYQWPGNIRELENVIERGIINSAGPKLHLMDNLNKAPKAVTNGPQTMAAVEREHIVRILEQTHWQVGGKNGATEILSLNRSTLRARMRKLHIQKPAKDETKG